MVVDNRLRDAMEDRRDFSSLRWIFGEEGRATSREGMFREIRMKVNAYNMLMVMVARNSSGRVLPDLREWLSLSALHTSEAARRPR